VESGLRLSFPVIHIRTVLRLGCGRVIYRATLGVFYPVFVMPPPLIGGALSDDAV